ncbi:hypothetical protein [Chromobacterium haemolyticum]|uniref:hypothetical protein n=1 Tax=Chromobacterium haemolyticum TaxID=394935 RepID=UPI0024487166|nr:hypothetical protein [Chromobacterium haemolyticum]MDH0342105.1 hypothetical protein [Chromobacterium haemolyticum]
MKKSRVTVRRHKVLAGESIAQLGQRLMEFAVKTSPAFKASLTIRPHVGEANGVLAGPLARRGRITKQLRIRKSA